MPIEELAVHEEEKKRRERERKKANKGEAAAVEKQENLRENGHLDADADDSRPWEKCVNEKFGSMERHLVSVVLHPKSSQIRTQPAFFTQKKR